MNNNITCHCYFVLVFSILLFDTNKENKYAFVIYTKMCVCTIKEKYIYFACLMNRLCLKVRVIVENMCKRKSAESMKYVSKRGRERECAHVGGERESTSTSICVKLLKKCCDLFFFF